MSPSDLPAGQRISLVGIRMDLDDAPSRLRDIAAEQLNLAPRHILECRILKRSLDARGRRKPHFEVRLGLVLSPEIAVPSLPAVGVWKTDREEPPSFLRFAGPRPLVLGAGPSGLFAALRLCAYGIKAVIVEQGEPVEDRLRRVARYWRHGELDAASNVQFGEGGAGTFSDGKLTYRGKDHRKQWVFERLVECGAPSEILFEAKPHLGTDRLRSILKRLRKTLLDCGCEIHYRTRVERLVLGAARVQGVETEAGVMSGFPVFFGPGHSARPLLAAVIRQGVAAQSKGFALGVRVEVPQQAVDRCQYGNWFDHPALPAAEFSVKARGRDGRDVYSFCMCPGGVVVPSSSEPGGLVVNGMSGSRRAGRWANAALVVTVRPDDFGDTPLGGFEFQRGWEERAHRMIPPLHTPGQRVVDFLAGVDSKDLPASSCPWRPYPTELDRCLPDFAGAVLRETLPRLQNQLPALHEGLLIGVETRTSSPLRLSRGKDFQSVGLTGLFPIGEGAGYAGGIVSCAVDGVAAVDAWVETLVEQRAGGCGESCVSQRGTGA